MKRIIRKLVIGNPYGAKGTSDAPRKFTIGSVIGLRKGDKTHTLSRIKFMSAHFKETKERIYEIWLLDNISQIEKCWKTEGVGKEEFQEEYDLNF